MQLLLVTLLYLLLGSPAYADQSVLINEFLIDPQPQQIEILNTSSETINISGWYIDDNGGTTFFTIPDNTVLQPHSCISFNSDFNLNKSTSDTVRLFDNTTSPTGSNPHLIDSYTYTKSLGINISFLRMPDGMDWNSGESSIGKFNDTKTSCIVVPTPTTTITPTSIPSPTLASSSPDLTITPQTQVELTPSAVPHPTPSTYQLSTYANIFINEVMVYPEANENEWMELANNNDFAVQLENWYIDDGENMGSVPKSFTLLIPAHSLAVFELSSAVFNNDGDQVRLLDPQKKEKNSFEYSNSDKNLSWGKKSTDSDEVCMQIPSKGLPNNICSSSQNIPTPTTPISTKLPITSSNKTTQVITPFVKPSLLNQLVSTTSRMKSYLPVMYSASKKPTRILPQNNEEEVLGITQHRHTSPMITALIRTLSFSSFSFSLVSIISLALKLKNMG